MKPFKITKRLINGRAVICGTWFSNGHFAVRRARLDPKTAQIVNAGADAVSAHFGTTASELSEDAIRRVVPNVKREYQRTEWLKDTGPYLCRMFQAEDGDAAYVQESYTQAFDLRALHGKDATSALMDAGSAEQASVIVMPCRA